MRALVLLACAAASMAMPAAALAEVPVNVKAPSILADPPGTARIAATLARDPGAWTVTAPGAVVTVAVQWLSCDATGAGCTPIRDATQNVYLVQPADAGHTFRLQEIATNGTDGSAPAVSAPSAVVPAPPVITPRAPLSGPVKQSPPTITGVAKLGGTLTAQNGTWTGTAPIEFTYQWMRCQPDCHKIAGATAQTYTVTQADAITSADGRQTVLTAYVGAANPYGAILTLINPGVAIDAPRLTPRTLGNALNASLNIVGTDGEIPQLLAHNGFTAHYYVKRAGRVDITWASHELGPLLAGGHATYGKHAHGWHTLRVRLTRRGRRLLRRSQHVQVSASAHYTPLGRPGGEGVGETLALSTDAPAEVV